MTLVAAEDAEPLAAAFVATTMTTEAAVIAMVTGIAMATGIVTAIEKIGLSDGMKGARREVGYLFALNWVDV